MTIRHEHMTARLVARYGGSAVLAVPGGFTGPEWDQTPLPDQEYGVQLVETEAEADLIADTAIQANDLIVAMLPHPSVTPDPSHRLIVGGNVYSVLAVKPVRSDPDGAVIYYRIVARA